jgi:GWxTD domain-containing protein
MKKTILILLFTFLLLPVIALPQNKFYFDVDYSIFKNVDSSSIIEFYFAFNQRNLKYIKTSDGFEAMANIDVSILDKEKNKCIFKDTYGLQSKVFDTTKSKLTNKLIGQQNFKLNSGKYLISLVGLDNNDKNKCDSVNFDVNIPVFDTGKTYMSDIQLATSIEKSDDKKSIFYKNGLEITPNSNMLYGMNLNTVWYYFEVYSLRKEFFSDSVFLISTITDLSNNVLMQKNKREKSNSLAFAEIGSFQIDSLDKGSYFVKIELIDKLSQISLKKEKKFFIYNALKTDLTEQKEGFDFLKSEYTTMKEDRINEEFDKTVFLRTQTETEDFSRLSSLDEKRKFMFNFWKKRDNNPFTPVNEFKVKYFTSIAEANKLFKQGFTEGWKTDRGRIYITYGKPEDIERYTFEAETKGYEIWYYETLQGGTLCVFIEQQPGSGYFMLEHSTIRGELRNDNWKDKLKKI